jgi:hypothetical protein
MTLDDGQHFFREVFAGFAKGHDGKFARELKKRLFGLVIHLGAPVRRNQVMFKVIGECLLVKFSLTVCGPPSPSFLGGG